MYNCFNLAMPRRVQALLLVVGLAFSTQLHAEIIDEFNDGTLSANWITNNYPQYGGSPNDTITFTEYTTEQFSAFHAPGYLKVTYDETNSNPQTTLLLRSDARLDTDGEFVQVDLQIESGAASANVEPGLALAPTDSGINQDRSSCAYITLRNNGYLKINAYGTNGAEIYDQAVAIPGYQMGNIYTLRLKRTASGVFQVWWGENMSAGNYAGTFDFGQATHPTVPGLVLSNGFNDYQVNFDRFVAGTSGGTGDVTSFGAVPDDGINDGVMIRGILGDFSQIYFPGGTYRIDVPLSIPASKTLYGPTAGSPAILQVMHDDGTYSATNTCLEIAGSDVTIEHLTIDKDFIDGSYAMGIHSVGGNNLTIEDVEIQDYSVRYGIHLIECDNFLITGCFIHSFMFNENNPTGYEADMIQDSPAGIRLTRCNTGEISYCNVFDIEVGADGRCSISELVPTYGPQNFQADCITVSDCSYITVSENDLWNSGELCDVLVSDNCTVTNNVMQMAFHLAIKCIGSQDNDLTYNYLGDAPDGIWMSDHSTGNECYGNLFDHNSIVNCGSRGIWDIAANSWDPNDASKRRIPWAVAGVCLDNNASTNTITYNNIYNYYSYLPEGIHQGTGANTIANNNLITAQYGPAGGPNAALLGPWTSGLTHEREDYGMNRLLVFFTYAREEGATIDCTGVTYGGQAMTQITERMVTEGTRRVYVSAWMLKQDKINMAQSATFSPTWNRTPDSVGYSSAFYENVNQAAPIYTSATGSATSGSTIAATAQATHSGDMVIYGAVEGPNDASFTANNGFTEDIELTISSADGCAGHKAASGANETASVNHTNIGTGAIVAGCLDTN